jgi:hypothetical protein
MTKFCQNPDLCRKVKYAQIFPYQQPDQVSMALTSVATSGKYKLLCAGYCTEDRHRHRIVEGGLHL